ELRGWRGSANGESQPIQDAARHPRSGRPGLLDSPMSTLARWRLVLGRYAEQGMPGALNGEDQRRDQALEYLYGREYEGRGLRKELGPGSLDPSQLTLVTWLNEVRELFPQDTVEIIEKHALDRYGLTELVTDPKTLERLEPNQ